MDDFDLFAASDRDVYGRDVRPGGRVPGVGPGTGAPAPFQVFDERSMRGAQSTVARVWDAADVPPATSLFLSAGNMKALQEAIRYRVFVESGGKHTIGYQSPEELTLIVRSIALQHGRNLGCDVAAQVRSLNARVIDFCVPRIVGEIRQYTRYREDISSLPVPIAHPSMVSSKGDRSLPVQTFI
jgi:hypothetical protein